MIVLINGVNYVPQPDIPNDKSLLAALEVRLDCDAGENITVRDYLRALLEKLWSEGGAFNGKRPFGNGAWQFDLYKALIAHKLIKGKLDSDGNVEKVDVPKADAYIAQLITAMCNGVRD